MSPEIRRDAGDETSRHEDGSPSTGGGDRPEGESDDRIRGIPEELPDGETVRWEGSPDVGSLARHVFHVRKLAVYFGLLILGRAWWARDAADPLMDWATGALLLGVLGAAAIGIGWLMSWLIARTTTYAITDRRVVMKIGIAFEKVINLPFDEIDGASRKRFGDGTGDVALEPREDRERIPYFLLWPHARPWRLSRPQPALRALPEMSPVVRLLGEGLRESAREGARDAQGAAGPAPARDDARRAAPRARSAAGG